MKICLLVRRNPYYYTNNKVAFGRLMASSRKLDGLPSLWNEVFASEYVDIRKQIDDTVFDYNSSQPFDEIYPCVDSNVVQLMAKSNYCFIPIDSDDLISPEIINTIRGIQPTSHKIIHWNCAEYDLLSNKYHTPYSCSLPKYVPPYPKDCVIPSHGYAVLTPIDITIATQHGYTARVTDRHAVTLSIPSLRFNSHMSLQHLLLVHQRITQYKDIPENLPSVYIDICKKLLAIFKTIKIREEIHDTIK